MVAASGPFSQSSLIDELAIAVLHRVGSANGFATYHPNRPDAARHDGFCDGAADDEAADIVAAEHLAAGGMLMALPPVVWRSKFEQTYAGVGGASL